MPLASIIISAISLLLSATVAVLTLFRRGKLCVTRPMLVGFLHEGTEPKIFLRLMLYATGKRGWIIEALYLRVQRGDGEEQVFSFWMHGETEALRIGSGLKVGEDGTSANHHFLPPKDSSFRFLAGEYVIKLHASIVNRKAAVSLSEIRLSLTDELASALTDPSRGVLFTWQPNLHRYQGNISEPVITGRDRSVSGASRGKPSWA